jgi:hypothetical protein
MTTIRGVARLALVVLALVAACGDNDHPGGEQLLVTPQTGLVTTEAGGAATFTVALTNVPLATRMITLTSSNPAEGTVSPQKLEFRTHNWKDPQTVTVVGVADHVVDGNQPYTVALTGEPDAGIVEVDVSLTNQDEDVAGFLITPSSGLVTTKAGGTATFTVQLTAQPTAAVTLPLASSNLMEGTIDQSSLTFTPDAWNAPQTVTITGVDDGLPDGNVQYLIVTGAATSADTNFNGVDPDDVFVTNLGHALTALQVTPVDPVIALGTGQQFAATALLDDNTTLDVTQAVTWSSSNGPVATISNTAGTVGFATSHDIGTATIQADWLGKSGSTLLTVTHATLASIQVTPANPSIAKGTFQQFAATGIYTDNSTQDLTAQVVWSSSDLTVGTISNNAGSQGLAHGIGIGTSTVQAALGSVTGSTTLTVTAATLVSIDVTPSNPSVAKGTGQQFAATGHYTDGTTQPLTSSVTWSSSDTSTATISNAPGTKGLASTLAVGSTTISATLNGVVGSTLLTVTAATLVSIQVTPTNPSTTKGATLQFTATGIYTDNSTQDLTTQASWASSLTTVATISNATGSQGLATAQAVGQTTISATFGGTTGSTILTVKPATLTSLQVTPTTPSAAKGTTVQFTAIATFSDNSTQDVTTQATWGSSSGGVATISNATGSQGLATAVGVGTTTISATFGGLFASTVMTVTAATLVSIQVTPVNPSIAKGTALQFTATAVYSDNSTQDVTLSATWSSSNTTVATIGNAPGNRGRATGASTGTSTITATFNGTSGSTLLTVTPATLQSIQITPANPSAPKGSTLQFKATGIYSDGTRQDLTTQATWSSSNTTVAAISNASGSQGLATTLATGTSTIRATFGGMSGSGVLTVTAATLVSISVTPPNPSAAKGTTVAFVATGLYTDSSTQNLTTQVTWGSSAPTIATISNAAGTQGVATAASTGTTTISATLGTITGSTTLTVSAATLVSIAVSPTNPTIPKGTSQQFTAIGTYTDSSTQDLTTQVLWQSNTIGVATISNAAGSQGRADSAGVGTTTISATFGGVTGSTTLTVTNAALVSISVTPTNPSIAKGTQLQFTASGLYTDGTSQDLTAQATWASTNSLVADVGATTGLAHGDSTGSVTISATFGGKTGSTTLTVTPATLVSIAVLPADPSVAKGSDLQFTALGTYTDSTTQDLTTQVTWASLVSTVATISNASGSQGLAHAAGPGVSTISATFGGKTGSTTLTVTAATLASIQVTPVDPSIAKGTNVQFTATGVFTDGTTQDLTTTATWNSSTSTVATISNASGTEGLAHAAATGSSTISATVGAISGSTTLTVTAATLTAIQVTPSDPSIAKGTQLQLTATALYSDGSIQDVTTQAAWSSSVPGTATVSTASGSQGLATGVAAGTTSIKATFGGTSGSTTLTVTAATLVSVSISPTGPSIANGTTQQFTVTGLYSDSTTQDLTASAFWASSVTTVATISTGPTSFGLATGTGPGTTTISATVSGLSDSTTLTVNGVVLTGVVVTPVNPTLAKGATAQFTCTGVYSDNSTQDLSTTALWATTNAAAASVSNASGSQGLVTAVDIGSANISCAVGGFTDTSTVTVTSATITSIDVSPTTPTIAAGVQLQFTATVHYSNGIVQDISDSATWTSSNTNAATISNQVGFAGLATTIAAGTTTITASFGGSSGTATLTVTNATCNTIVVTPANPKMAKQTQLQFIATCTFSDSTQADITSVATWTSSNTNAATISNQSGFQGNATGVAAGTTTISATFQGKVGSTTLTVTNAVLVSITLSPANPTVTAGAQVKFTATGHFSDGTTQDLTIQCSWSSTNKFVAKTTMARKRRGLITTVAAGTATINATTLGVTGSTTITVQ